eukprot:813702-Rhodomonas_salina.1
MSRATLLPRKCSRQPHVPHSPARCSGLHSWPRLYPTPSLRCPPASSWRCPSQKPGTGPTGQRCLPSCMGRRSPPRR